MIRRTLFAALLLSSACASGGMVHMTDMWSGGGTVLLEEGSYMDRTAEAVTLMATHCNGSFRVVDPRAPGGYTDAPGPDDRAVDFECSRGLHARR